MGAPSSTVKARLSARRLRALALGSSGILAAGLAATLAGHGAAADTATAGSIQVVQPPTGGCTPPAAYCFEPPAVSATAGSTVTWTNTTGASHTVTRCPSQATSPACPKGSGDGNDQVNGNLAPAGGNGATYSVNFSSPGTYYYYCTIHTYMHGMVTVNGPSPNPSPSGPTVFSPPPASSPPPDTSTPTPTPTPAPTPTASPSESPSPDSLTSPSDSDSASPSDTPVGGSTGTGSGNGNGSGGSPLVAIVLIIIALLAIGGGILSYRLYRGSRLPPPPPII